MPKGKTVYRYTSAWWVREWDKLLFLFVFVLFFLFSPGQNIYTVSTETTTTLLRRLPFAIPTPAPYPVNKWNIFPGAEITATGVVVYDTGSGVFLYRRNEDIFFSPASTTKILTALVALDTYQLDDVLTVKSVIDGQNMGLISGERMTVENLLFGTLVASANDATYTLAENYPGGVTKFVEAMNDKAKALHLDSSTFTNPVGFDDARHKMTPMDLARLASFALSNKTIAKIVAIPQITISDVTHTYFHSLKNINELLGKIPGVGGIKTGWTEEAGENLVTLVDRNGHHIIIVVLKSKDRFGDTARLIDWVFLSHVWQEVEAK